MAARFNFIKTPINGLTVIERNPIEDSRGFFERFFCSEEMKEAGLDKPIVQINHSFSCAKGAVRGMHFQFPPYSETKIVTCMKGKIFDVAVDIRSKSPTFLHWHGEILSENDHKSLFIPEGFAHGFQTLTEDCQLLYFHTASYRPQAEGALNPQDPKLQIGWPQPITEISERDQSHPLIDGDFNGITI